MGSRSNTSTVDGRPVVFSYQPSDEIDKSKLTFTKGSELDPDSKWTNIACQDIIVLHPSQSADSSHNLFCVEPNEAAGDDSTVSPVLAKALVVTGLPESFIHDFPPRDNVSLFNRYDHTSGPPNWHVILSIGSGTLQALSVWEHLIRPIFETVGLHQDNHYSLHVTSSELTVSELAHEILLPQANLGVQQSVLLLSGDGGMVDIVNTLLAGQRSPTFKKPNVALMPLGTGNALAHSATITADNTMGFRTFWHGSAKELPIFRASFSPGARLLTHEAREERVLHQVDGIPVAHGAVVASWGLHAGLVADSDTAEYRKFGAERFQMAAKEALYPADGSPAHGYKGKISILPCDSGTWQPVDRDTHGYVLATYCSHLEKGFNISPASKPLDGRLRLVHFGAMSGDEVMSIMTKAYQQGQHVQDERVRYLEIDGLRIDFAEADAKWRRICIDGKIIRVEEGGWVEVRSGVEGVVDLIIRR